MMDYLINGNGITDFPLKEIKTGIQDIMVHCSLNEKKSNYVTNVKYDCEKKIKDFLCVN